MLEYTYYVVQYFDEQFQKYIRIGKISNDFEQISIEYREIKAKYNVSKIRILKYTAEIIEVIDE